MTRKDVRACSLIMSATGLRLVDDVCSFVEFLFGVECAFAFLVMQGNLEGGHPPTIDDNLISSHMMKASYILLV